MKDFLGSGLGFPLRLGDGGRFELAREEQKVEQSIRILLSTAFGERLMRRDYGCAIHDLVFESDSPALRATVAESVRRALRLHEPRIDVLDVTVDCHHARQNELHVDISYRLRRNNAQRNMVFPFFLREGTR